MASSPASMRYQALKAAARSPRTAQAREEVFAHPRRAKSPQQGVCAAAAIQRPSLGAAAEELGQQREPRPALRREAVISAASPFLTKGNVLLACVSEDTSYPRRR